MPKSSKLSLEVAFTRHYLGEWVFHADRSLRLLMPT